MKNNIPKFIVSCEGETEVLYFNRLQKLLIQSGYTIEIKPKKQSVSSIIKSHNGNYSQIGEKHLARIEDVECNNDESKLRIEKSVKAIKIAEKYAKTAQLYISNLSFEVWLLLHKVDNVKNVTSVDDYPVLIGKAFDVKINSTQDYKNQKNLNRIIEKITLDDICLAIERARILHNNHYQDCRETNCVANYKYYLCNPDTIVHEFVRDILNILNIDYKVHK